MQSVESVYPPLGSFHKFYSAANELMVIAATLKYVH